VGEIQASGVLMREMARAGMALHYHLYALAPLIMIAELGEANGMDLYARTTARFIDWSLFRRLG
jgi:poly(beta-D-mannuronate) lyase